jgi:hypothetical protein
MDYPVGENCVFTHGEKFTNLRSMFTQIVKDMLDFGWTFSNNTNDIAALEFPVALVCPQLLDPIQLDVPNWIVLFDPDYELEFINKVEITTIAGNGVPSDPVLEDEVIKEYGRIIIGTDQTIVGDIFTIQTLDTLTTVFPDNNYDVNIHAFLQNGYTSGQGNTRYPEYREYDPQLATAGPRVNGEYNSTRFDSFGNLTRYIPGEIYPLISGFELTDSVFYMNYQLSLAPQGFVLCINSQRSPYNLPGRVIAAQRLTECKTNKINLELTDPVFCLFSGLNRPYKANNLDKFLIVDPNKIAAGYLKYEPTGFNQLYQIVVREGILGLPTMPKNITRDSEYSTSSFSLSKQISISANDYVYLQFPIGLTTTTHAYGTQWMDMLGLTSAGVAAQSNIIDVKMADIQTDNSVVLNKYKGTMSNTGCIEGFRYWTMCSSKRTSKQVTVPDPLYLTLPKNKLFLYDLKNDTQQNIRYTRTTDGSAHSHTCEIDLYGQIKYKPVENFIGTDKITYTVTAIDGKQSAEGLISFIIVDTYDLEVTIVDSTDSPVPGITSTASVLLSKISWNELVSNSLGKILFKNVPFGNLVLRTPDKYVLSSNGKAYKQQIHTEDVQNNSKKVIKITLLDI